LHDGRDLRVQATRPKTQRRKARGQARGYGHTHRSPWPTLSGRFRYRGVDAGSHTSTTVPLPTRLCIRISPDAARIARFTLASPSPVPRPAGLVVKKGSNARARVSESTPTPRSLSSIRTQQPSGTLLSSPGATLVQAPEAADVREAEQERDLGDGQAALGELATGGIDDLRVTGAVLTEPSAARYEARRAARARW
jgi:hypothetical protein